MVNPASIVGRFDADGGGNVSNGLYDSNIGGTLSGQQSFATGAFCQIDATTSGVDMGAALHTSPGKILRSMLWTRRA